MKKLMTFFTAIGLTYGAYSQCVPINCLATLPPYGGICDTVLADGTVNQAYSDFESFHTTTACFDAGIISPANAGTNIRIVRVDNFTFSGLPSGCNAAPNQAIYNTPANGCISVTGTPTQVGLFKVRADFLVDINAYPFGCSSFPITQNDNASFYELDLLIRPRPTFTMPSTYCLNDPLQSITITGSSGGTFTGPGISGNTFNPSLAGVGFHTIKYVVSLQQGAAVAPASDSSSFTVQVVAPTFNYYVDADSDTYGDENATPIQTCNASAPAGYSANNLDCNDANAGINPAALEIPANSIDENCDGLDGAIDNDNDGFNNSVDCDDNNAAINPGATEICDGIDNDCDGNIDEGFTIYTYYLDSDGDGYGSVTSITSCSATPPVNYVTDNTDCNDANAQINPGMSETCDGLDNDCNALVDDGLTNYTYYLDGDLDGYGVATTIIDTCATFAPAGFAPLLGDCNDSNPNINPGVSELCDGVDNNCDGNQDENLALITYYEDADADGYGNPNSSQQNCGLISGYVDNNDDCDDGNFLINPSVNDTPGNGIDENCDGVDGYLSLNNSLQALGIQVFPNPADNLVQLSGNVNGICQVRIFNIQGQLILDRVITLQGVVELNVNEMLPGSYMLEISHPDTGLRGLTKLLIIR